MSTAFIKPLHQRLVSDLETMFGREIRSFTTDSRMVGKTNMTVGHAAGRAAVSVSTLISKTRLSGSGPSSCVGADRQAGWGGPISALRIINNRNSQCSQLSDLQRIP